MNYYCKQILWLLIVLFTIYSVQSVEADISRIFSRKTGLGANDLGDIVWDGNNIWVSGSGTLTTRLWGDGRLATDWISYSGMEGFGQGSIAALYASGDTIMVSWTYTKEFGEEIATFGDGYSISIDSGQTWRHVPLSDIFPDRSANAGYYTTTYDISFSEGSIWCSTTSGFVLVSKDFGHTWTTILPNNENLNLQNPNHHAQCLDIYGDTVWVGTFQGMNVSFDRGATWINSSWPPEGSGNPDDQWPGNFCTAVEHKVVDGKTHVWVGSLPYFGFGKYGICHTEDEGSTWEYKTTRFNAWNFAFGYSGAGNPAISDSTVFAASDSGLVVTYDLGKNWDVIPIRESDNLYWEDGTVVFGVIVVEDTIWVTSADGLAMSDDWGETWNIYRGVTRVKTLDENKRNVGISSMFDDVKTYAFPNPFSPRRYNDNYSRTRIQYALTNDAKITVSIYNYSGKLIKQLVSGEFRAGGRDYQEMWDGRDGESEIIPNGVYFFVIETDSGDTARGKIMVID